ncbi:MAG: hypothetical protein OEV49_09910 [candidate division Zixibacteria bacterium]|nr:hypothetical protein [candidate division Zixibacteria bacterium]MDH3938368.1 hypothetical protein [candidate division Zixibacteria bacterium]MDH4035626.1 hypothetical protein [candidate division Zixibacteria bacterium]
MSSAVFYNQTECDPYYNMACDEWMFQQACRGSGTLYLRLYGWEMPTITFGVNQAKERALDFSQLENTPVIRRITGGRALLHDQTELTYCLAVNLGEWDGRPWTEAPSHLFRVVAEALTEFATTMGKPADYCRRSGALDSRPDFFHRAPCFASRSRYEVVADGRKIVASAARKYGDTILQHGAIKLNGVVAHPALYRPGGPVASYSVDSQPISDEHRLHGGRLLAKVLARSLNVEFRSGSFCHAELTEQNDLASAIKLSPLNRRFFLHNQGT